jgi:hypothetical protein
MDHTKKEGKKDAGQRVDVEPCVLALHRGSAGPALAPLPMKWCSFFRTCIGVLLFNFLCLSSLGDGWMRCCCGGACAFSDVEAEEFKKQKLRLSRFFACLSTSIVGCFAFLFSSGFLAFWHRVTQVYNPGSFA